jgi:hypothetical protein
MAFLSLATSSWLVGFSSFMATTCICLFFGHAQVTYAQQGVKDYVRERTVMPIWAVVAMVASALPFIVWLIKSMWPLAILALLAGCAWGFRYYKTRIKTSK